MNPRLAQIGQQAQKVVTHPVLSLAFRLVLGLVFIYASLDKIAHPLAFAENIAAYRLMPLSVINLMAITLPWIEIVSGVLLILGAFVRGNLAIINVLLLIFVVAISQALFRGLSLSCGCFETGAEAEALGRQTLYRDLVMLVMGAQIYLFDTGRLGLDRWRKSPTTPSSTPS